MNMKRLLLLLVTGIMIFTALAFPAAAEPGQETSSLPQGYKFMQALGVDTSVVPSGEIVSRGSFIVAVMELMGLNTFDKAENFPFTDVEEDSNVGAALEYALALGFVSKAEHYYPERPVTYNEAFKIAVSAMGYQTEAIHRGGYPTGYLYYANSLDLNKGMDLVGNGNLSAYDFYTLLYNMAVGEVQTVYAITLKNDTFQTYHRRQSFVSAYWDLFQFEGTVRGNEASYLYDAQLRTREGYILIDEELYLADMFEYPLGCEVEGYAKVLDDDSYAIIYAERMEDVLNINTDAQTILDGQTISYYNEAEKQRKARLDDGCAVLLNGKAFDTFTEDFLTGKKLKLTLFDNDSDGVYEVLSIYEPRYIKVHSVDVQEGYIYGSDNQGSIEISEKTVLKITGKSGSITPEDIVGDQCFEYYISEDGLLVEMKELTTWKNGVVNGFEQSGDALYLDDERIVYTSYFKEVSLNEIKLGDTVTILLSSAGEAVLAERGAAKGYPYAYLYAVDIKELALSKAIRVKMFTQDDEFVIYTLAEEVILDGEKEKADAVGTFLETSGEMLVRYHLDEEGYIDRLNTEYSTAPYTVEGEGVERYKYSGYDSSTKIYYNSSQGYFVNHFMIDNSTVKFIVCTDRSADEKQRFSLATSLSFIANGSTPTSKYIKAYNVDDNGRADVLVREHSSVSGLTVSEESPFGVVQSATRAVNSEGEESIKLVLYASDKYNTFYIPVYETFLSKIRPGEEFPFCAGDVVRYRLNSRGVVTDMALDFDGRTRTIKYSSASEWSGITYNFGKLSSIGASSMTIIENTPEAKKLCFVWKTGDACLVDSRGNVETTPRLSLVGCEQDETNYDNVLIITNRGTLKQVIVYK